MNPPRPSLLFVKQSVCCSGRFVVARPWSDPRKWLSCLDPSPKKARPSSCPYTAYLRGAESVFEHVYAILRRLPPGQARRSFVPVPGSKSAAPSLGCRQRGAASNHWSPSCRRSITTRSGTQEIPPNLRMGTAARALEGCPIGAGL